MSALQQNDVPMNTNIWIPGSLMSYRDILPMLECLFLVNDLQGGKGHHDGHMKGRSEQEVLGNPMLQLNGRYEHELRELNNMSRKHITTKARPAPGSENLILPRKILSQIELPAAGKTVSPRAGSEVAYAAIAESFPDHMFIVSCDLDPSTKLAKAKSFLKEDSVVTPGKVRITLEISLSLPGFRWISDENMLCMLGGTSTPFLNGVALTVISSSVLESYSIDNSTNAVSPAETVTDCMNMS